MCSSNNTHPQTKLVRSSFTSFRFILKKKPDFTEFYIRRKIFSYCILSVIISGMQLHPARLGKTPLVTSWDDIPSRMTRSLTHTGTFSHVHREQARGLNNRAALSPAPLMTRLRRRQWPNKGTKAGRGQCPKISSVIYQAISRSAEGRGTTQRRGI